jgi:hypothetical protein
MALQIGAGRHVGFHDADLAPEPLHLGGRALGSGLIHLGDDDVSAHSGQLERRSAADAAAGAGDDRDLS